MMNNNSTVLSKIVEQTCRFRTSKGSNAPQSIFDMSFITKSIQTGDQSSIMSSTDFSFDDEIVNSQAYRRALAKAYEQSQDEDRKSKTVEEPDANSTGSLSSESQEQADSDR